MIALLQTSPIPLATKRPKFKVEMHHECYMRKDPEGLLLDRSQTLKEILLAETLLVPVVPRI